MKVGALQAVSREAYFTVVDGKNSGDFVLYSHIPIYKSDRNEIFNLIINSGAGFDSSNVGPPSENTGTGSKKHRFPNLRGLFVSCN